MPSTHLAHTPLSAALALAERINGVRKPLKAKRACASRRSESYMACARHVTPSTQGLHEPSVSNPVSPSGANQNARKTTTASKSPGNPVNPADFIPELNSSEWQDLPAACSGVSTSAAAMHPTHKSPDPLRRNRSQGSSLYFIGQSGSLV
jgi:hypothetical protein